MLLQGMTHSTLNCHIQSKTGRNQMLSNDFTPLVFRNILYIALYLIYKDLLFLYYLDEKVMSYIFDTSERSDDLN